MQDALVACSLDAAGLVERRQAWASLGSAVRSAVRTESGVRLDLTPDRQTTGTLLDLVAAERACCAWASWTVTNSAQGTVLEVTATGEGVAAVHGMLEALVPA